MICDYIKIENPFVYYGNNKPGDFVSRIIYPDDSEGFKNLVIEAVSPYATNLFKVVDDETYGYSLYLDDCALLYSGNCRCVPNRLTLRCTYTDDNDETVVEECTYNIYTTSIHYIENAVSMMGTYPKLTLHGVNLPILDANMRTPCDIGYDPSTATPQFSILLTNTSNKIKIENASFETRFCQMFYNSISISKVYNAKSLFDEGDALVIKIKTGVDENGNDIYEEHSTTTYPDGTTKPILVRRVQNDNTITLEMAVDFTLELCNNNFIVEVLPKTVCSEIKPDDLSISDDGVITFGLTRDMLPSDMNGDEVCMPTVLSLSAGGCDDNAPRTSYTLLRYKYDGSKVDGKYTTGTQCIYNTPIELNYENTGDDTAPETNGVYGKNLYVKIKDRSKCCSIAYNQVKTKVNERIAYKYGSMTLNGITVREGDVVWLAAQYTELPRDDEGNVIKSEVIDGNGLWIVHEQAPWEFYDEVKNDTFIDLGARVTDTVKVSHSSNVSRKYGNYWMDGVYLSSGSVVNLQNQDDGMNGLWRITCGDWEFIGSAGPTSGTSIDASDKIVTHNDIDFCKCGVYHIWYYYVNNACVLNTAMRTVKVVGNCNGKDGTLVPGNKIKITDYYIQTEVDKELIPSAGGDPYIDPCLKRVETFDAQYRIDITDIPSNCGETVVSPHCTEITLCDHTYGIRSNDLNKPYLSSDSSGFSMVFWKYEYGNWNLYALVGITGKRPHEYQAYKLSVPGNATIDMVDVSDWFIPHPPTGYVYSTTINESMKTAKFAFDSDVIDLKVGDSVDCYDNSISPKKVVGTIDNIIESDNKTYAIVSFDSISDFRKTVVNVEESNENEETSDEKVEILEVNVVVYTYTFAVPDVIISDPSWKFKSSTEFNVVEISDVGTSYSIGKLKYKPEQLDLSVGSIIETASTDINIRSMSATVSEITENEDGTLTARLDYQALVPKKTKYVLVGFDENMKPIYEKVETTVKMIYVSDNTLNYKTISEDWTLNSNTTKIFIPKSYEFRYYNTAISVSEFVDIYNSFGKWKCIQPVERYIVIGTDDDNYLVTDDGLYLDLEDEI